MATSAKERRYRRVQLNVELWIAVQGGGRRAIYRCVTMGLGGFSVRCREPLPEGSVVRFAFELGSEVIRGTAGVRNATRDGMGLAFLSLRTEDRGKVRSFLERPRSASG